MSADLDDALATLGDLNDGDLLKLHREVCRRAAAIYNVRYATIREANFRAAMGVRDTRFVKTGVSWVPPKGAT